MTDRERLIELLAVGNQKVIDAKPAFPKEAICIMADHLLANGVIVPPCGVGWTIYLLNDGGVFCGQVKSIYVYLKTMRINGMYWNEDKQEWCDFTSPLCCFGKDVFLTKEEAERALKEREQV